MKKYKICVYAICKNEEKFIDRWVESMSEADYIVVCDTGSTDKSVEMLKSKENVYTHTISISPWRFDEARNKCIDAIPDDVDICICTDLDEVFDPGWRDILENAWTPYTKVMRYTFVWQRDSEGNARKTSSAQKIHARRDFRWIYPVHEILDYSGTDPMIYTDTPELRITHLQDHTKSRAQYLPLLELSAKLFPTYDRNIHYLGREYMYYGKYEECIDTLKKHLQLPNALWADERCASMRYIAQSYMYMGQLADAKAWFYKAIGEAPHTREPYLGMATLAYHQHDWPTVYHMAEEALLIAKPTGSYLDDPDCWGYLFYDYAAISCYYLGLGAKAIAFARQALTFAPNDERLQTNLNLCLARYNH
ncbi:MAG: tetratricopeptide repeat-containing glycosyltransferase [Cellulosilyticaceae bacterium]